MEAKLPAVTYLLMPKQLLIADDSYLIRETIKNVLSGRTDIAVCGEASNGLEAVEKAKTLKPDLILLDLAMPEMNGAETASVLKMTVPGVRIILFTMYSENVGSYLTSAIGIDAVLSKPDGMTALLSAIETALTPTSTLIEEQKSTQKPAETTLPTVELRKASQV
ncbi:MAG TPA: response regulator transcription factor [Candidatus Dormibacteraeota bacterium]|nr:response regulator transcription factor [Candidatus Dormibacteraeota bacterium]